MGSWSSTIELKNHRVWGHRLFLKCSQHHHESDLKDCSPLGKVLTKNHCEGAKKITQHWLPLRRTYLGLIPNSHMVAHNHL